MRPYDFDVALWNIKVKNATLSLSLVGNPWCRTRMLTD